MTSPEPLVFRFKCSQCDEWHEGRPSVGYNAPHYYAVLSPEEQKTQANCDSDFCIVRHAEGPGADHFIRAVLEVPIIGTNDAFMWGVWSSLSETNYRAYEQCFSDETDAGGDAYPGWFSNNLAGYPSTLGLKCQVRLRSEGRRPLIELDAGEHPLCRDYHNGITLEQAHLLFERLFHPDKLS